MSGPTLALAIAVFTVVLPRDATRSAGGSGDGASFREVAADVGVGFRHEPGLTGEFHLTEITGSGAAVVDYDSDGDLDVYLVQGSPGASQSSRLFRNRQAEDRRLTFVDVTETAGVGFRGIGMGVATGDYDNDGDPDMFVTAFGPDALYRNNGDGTFTDVARAAGVSDERWNASAAFVDYDADGDLDLFVTAYVDFTVAGNRRCHDPAGERDYCLPAEYKPQPSRFYRNEGSGRFTDVTAASGIGSAAGAGLGVVTLDVNRDGWIDLYVANDGTPNHLWINQGNGAFKEAGLASGTAFDASGRAEAGMGLAAGDVDGDGDEDLFVTNLIGETNTLYLNDGTGGFEDATVRFKLSTVSLPYTGFGTDWLDFDNDGRLDLFVANGAVAIVDSLRGAPYPYQQKHVLLRNEGPGGFRDVSADAGAALAPAVGRGAAFGDLDNDGDVDIVVSNNNGPARVLLNEYRPAGHWLSVRLEGRTAPREGLGALVSVLGREVPTVVRRVRTDGSYLSASDRRVHVGLGAAETIEGIVVEWSRGRRERWPSSGVDRVVTLVEGSGKPELRPDR